MGDYLRSKDDIKRNFTKVPDQLWQLYTRLPDFNAEHAMLYVIFLAFFNEEYGYSFPTIKDLELRTGWTDKTIKKRRDVLEKYDLIERVARNHFGGNNRYYVKLPLDEPAFNAKYGGLLGDYKTREERLNERAQSDKERLESVKQAFDIDDLI